MCGHIVFLAGGPIVWHAHKEQRNSGSSCESEVKATDQCRKSVQHLRLVMGEVGLTPNALTQVYNNNQACVNWSKGASHKAMRHVNIRENRAGEAQNEFNKIRANHKEAS